MALNRVLASADNIRVAVPDGTESGDPLAVGSIPGVAFDDKGADGKSTLQTNGAYDLAVKGVGLSGNAAIELGDILHIQSNGDINKKTDAGVRFGYALGAVDSGATTTITVKVGY